MSLYIIRYLQKTTASTYATSTVALFDNYKQQFENVAIYLATP